MNTKPKLIQVLEGQVVSPPPVWMMRQAGRHMAAYRALVAKYPTFRERSEIPEVRRVGLRAVWTRRAMGLAERAGRVRRLGREAAKHVDAHVQSVVHCGRCELHGQVVDV